MDSNKKDVYNIDHITNTKKRYLSNQDDNIEINCVKSTNSKRHRVDLICVICQGPAFGYNFGQISCSSCKEFFRRTARLPTEKTKCIDKKNRSTNVRCKIRFDIKQKCQRCRLLKCFESGMRTDHLMTPEEKLSKLQRIEQNRHIRSAQIIHKDPLKTITINTRCEPNNILTDVDRACLSHIENAYLSAIRSIPSASSVISFEPSFSKTFSFHDIAQLDNITAIKLINFLRSIPEFESLNEEDRILLAKYNLIPLIVLRDLLVFDRKIGMFYDDNGNTSRTLADEKFAQCCHSLCILFYGYEEILIYVSIVRSIVDSLDNDTLIIKLLMLVLIFLKGMSLIDERVWILSNPQSVFDAHTKYVDLLFRYLIDRYSFDVAVIKMLRITENIFRIQQNARHYQEVTTARSYGGELHPLLKSLLGLT